MGSPRLEFVQCLRAFAAICIVLVHLADYNRNIFFSADGFNIGVDIFFVLSGFIIFYTTYEMKPGFNSVRLFLKKRLLRLVPLYWIFTIALALFYLFATGGLTIKVGPLEKGTLSFFSSLFFKGQMS